MGTSMKYDTLIVAYFMTDLCGYMCLTVFLYCYIVLFLLTDILMLKSFLLSDIVIHTLHSFILCCFVQFIYYSKPQ